MEPQEVFLGYLEPAEPGDIRLTSMYFPSKAGGCPAWLDPVHLPSSESLLCPKCRTPMTFMLQLYSPIEEHPETFHRMLYVFVCADGSCNSDGTAGWKVLRCQLPRKNDFYSFDPPPEHPEKSTARPDIAARRTNAVRLCCVCGCRGGKTCGRCKRVSYCGEAHQRAHWRTSHKAACVPPPAPLGDDPLNEDGTLVSVPDVTQGVPWRFPEHEIIVESEELEARKKEKRSEKEEKLYAEYRQKVGADFESDEGEEEEEEEEEQRPHKRARAE
eukprot:TRINITY_DN2403_c1_g1_i1.p2 TRINITY_DN2403_c1_g1~~TRINITY_DN2403_c1_g1_i1.p2  ORF type:complete len:286 (+),score=48.98 TRINITY_DN2403_c1_g1_i1:43-858(+)